MSPPSVPGLHLGTDFKPATASDCPQTAGQERNSSTLGGSSEVTYNLLLPFPTQKQTFSFAQGFLTANVSRGKTKPEDPKSRKGQVP